MADTDTKLITAAEVLELIPPIDQVDMVFPAGDRITKVYDKLTPHARVWEEQAEELWGMTFFSQVFYGGGHMPEGREEFSQEEIIRVANWLRAAMRSFHPKHEDKERVCGMLWTMFFAKPKEVS